MRLIPLKRGFLKIIRRIQVLFFNSSMTSALRIRLFSPKLRSTKVLRCSTDTKAAFGGGDGFLLWLPRSRPRFGPLPCSTTAASFASPPRSKICSGLVQGVGLCGRPCPAQTITSGEGSSSSGPSKLRPPGRWSKFMLSS